MSISATGFMRGDVVPRRPSPPARPKRAPWGVLELIAVSPTIFPALLYIPGMFAVRTPLRILDFTLVLIAWAWVLSRGRRAVGRPYIPQILLGACAIWLLLSIFHPTTNSLFSGTAEAVLVVSIMCPVFWVPQLKIPPERLTRVLRLLFFANLLSSLWGLGQIYKPDRFNPPDLQIAHRMEGGVDARSMTTAAGRTIIRPCGLTDTPGGAAVASANVLLIGLIWSLRPMAFWRRGILIGLVFLAMGVIYMSQVRVTLLTSVGSLAVTTGVFVLRRNFGKATVLLVILASLVVSSLAWAAYVGGAEAVERFAALLDSDAATIYKKNRGGFVQRTIENDVPRYPLGAGLGRWGQIFYYFGDKKDPFGVGRGELYSEVQLTSWVYDGGLPLVFGYSAAIAVAMWITFRIAVHGNDPEVSFWACVIFAMDLTLAVSVMGYMPFIGPSGVQFWLLTTALYVANEQAGVAARKAKRAALRGMT